MGLVFTELKISRVILWIVLKRERISYGNNIVLYFYTSCSGALPKRFFQFRVTLHFLDLIPHDLRTSHASICLFSRGFTGRLCVMTDRILRLKFVQYVKITWIPVY